MPAMRAVTKCPSSWTNIITLRMGINQRMFMRARLARDHNQRARRGRGIRLAPFPARFQLDRVFSRERSSLHNGPNWRCSLCAFNWTAFFLERERRCDGRRGVRLAAVALMLLEEIRSQGFSAVPGGREVAGPLVGFQHLLQGRG